MTFRYATFVAAAITSFGVRPILRFYNLTRRHSSLGNVSPIDFERMKAVA